MDEAEWTLANRLLSEHCDSQSQRRRVPPDSFFIAKEKEDWEALKNKDKTAAARLLADDFVGMYDTGYSTKSEWIKQIDGRYTVDDYTIEGVKVLRPSPTTTLLLYKATLTKLNYNACVFADGEPVTLKFTDRVGEILTAGPIGTDTPPLPFKFHI